MMIVIIYMSVNRINLILKRHTLAKSQILVTFIYTEQSLISTFIKTQIPLRCTFIPQYFQQQQFSIKIHRSNLYYMVLYKILMISWLSGKKQTEKPQELSLKRVEQIMTLVTSQLNILISRELGQHVIVPQDIITTLKQQIKQFLKQQTQEATKQLENSLINVKERYNHIVGALEQTKQGLREFHTKIGESIQDFVTVISEVLSTKELLVPVKDIKRGLLQNSQETVQRYFNLLGKLYMHQHGKVLESNAQIQNELKQNKSLESQIILLRQQKKLIEKKVQQIELQKTTTIKNYLGKQQALLIKLKASDQKLVSTIEELKETRKKVEQLQINTSVLIQSEEANKEMKQSKQQRHLQSIKKLNQEKMQLQDRYKQLQIQLSRLKNQQQQIINHNIQNTSLELQASKNRISVLQYQLQKLKNQVGTLTQQKQNMVQKNVIKGMLEVYMDEGKEWSIKNQVQKQIFLLLDIKQKQQPQKEQNKGWFKWL